eukprot:2421262-Prymnesium_polylepis.1
MSGSPEAWKLPGRSSLSAAPSEGDHVTGVNPATGPKATSEKPTATGYVASDDTLMKGMQNF